MGERVDDAQVAVHDVAEYFESEGSASIAAMVRACRPSSRATAGSVEGDSRASVSRLASCSMSNNRGSEGPHRSRFRR